MLLLDDLIGRQRLEDLAALGKELTDAHQRLRDLLERYQKTKDPALRRQLEREARELRARLAELAQKIAAVKARNDVPEEWRNMPDLKNVDGAGAQAGRDAREGQRRRPGTRAGRAGQRSGRSAQDDGSERGRVRRRAVPAGEPGRRRADEEDRRHRGRRAGAAQGDAGGGRSPAGRDGKAHALARSTSSSRRRSRRSSA